MLRLRPKSLGELVEQVLQAPQGFRYIAGGTDLTIRIHLDGLDLHLADITSLEDLKGISLYPHGYRVGSTVTFSRISASNHLPGGLRAMASKVGSPQIRSRGTMGGNVGNLSPAGDAIPMLMALNATMEVLQFQEEAVIPGSIPMGDMKPGPFGVLPGPRDLITGFSIPRWDFSHFGKVGSRRTVTISKLSVGCALDRGGKRCRLYLGAVGSLPIRCGEAEDAIVNLSGRELLAELPAILSRAVERAIPNRASMPYKREAVKALGLELAQDLVSEGGV